MATSENISMNSSRRFDPSAKEKKELSIYKEMLGEKDEKIKELTEKNEKYEKDYLKLQIQLKTAEDKLKIKSEKEYVTSTNTSSNFMLPSEFKKLWEDFCNKNISDCFIDFYDLPEISFHLIQELLLICSENFKIQAKQIVDSVVKILHLNKENFKYLEISLRGVFQEYFIQIFENEERREEFFRKTKKSFTDFIDQKFPDLGKVDEVDDLISGRCFKELIGIIKKILLYIDFHEPPLKLKLERYEERKIEIKKFKNSDCVCVEGIIKDAKNCLILLHPPLLKNGFAFQGLKPVVIVYEGGNLKEDCQDQYTVRENLIEKLNQEADDDKNYMSHKSIPNNDDSFTMQKNQTSSKLEIKNTQNNKVLQKTKSFGEKILNISDSLHCDSKQSPSKENTNEVRNLMKEEIKEFEKQLDMEENKPIESSRGLGLSKEQNVSIGLDTIEIQETKNENLNFRSTSHHNLFSNCEKFLSNSNKPNFLARTFVINNNNTGNSSLAEGTYKNERNKYIVTDQIRDKFLKSYEKLEHLVHTSRSQYDSNNENEEFVNFENVDLCDIENAHLYYDEKGPLEKFDRLDKMTASLCNSFASNHKNEVQLKEPFAVDNVSNTSEHQNKTMDKIQHQKIANLTANILYNHSDKKTPKGNMYVFQSSDRGVLDLNSITKTIEKLANKNLNFSRSGNKNTNRSLSKTPKNNKPKPNTGYSPRNNLYILNNEKPTNNNIIIKVAQKKNRNPGAAQLQDYKGQNFNMEEKKTSKNSSLSKEKINYNIKGNLHKTIELKEGLKEINNSQNYKEYKGKIKIGTNNYIVQAVKHNPNNPNLTSLSNIQQSQNLNFNMASSKHKSNTSYSKQIDDVQQKRRIIQKDKDRNPSNPRKTGKSIDRRVLTNAQTKISVDELLSFKKNERGKGSPIHKDQKEKQQITTENKSTKTNFLNIKYA